MCFCKKISNKHFPKLGLVLIWKEYIEFMAFSQIFEIKRKVLASKKTVAFKKASMLNQNLCNSGICIENHSKSLLY